MKIDTEIITHTIVELKAIARRFDRPLSNKPDEVADKWQTALAAIYEAADAVADVLVAADIHNHLDKE